MITQYPVLKSTRYQLGEYRERERGREYDYTKV